jgi:hypothetical protein
VSTPTSEPRWDPLAGDLADPDTYLTSTEDLTWSQPRAAWRRGVADGPDPDRKLLVLTIDPPAVGQQFGLGGDDVHQIVVTPVDPKDSVDPLVVPVDVHILLPRERWTPAVQRYASGDLRNVARGRLVATWEQAEQLDRSLQRMNGPRR